MTRRSYQEGVYERAVEAIKRGEGRGLPRLHQLPPCSTAPIRSGWPQFFDDVMAMGIDGMIDLAGLCL